MVFPLIKLGSLFAKSLVKPVTRRLQSYASQSPRFSASCHWMANGYFRTYNGLAKGLRLNHRLKPPTQEQAVELGTEVLGESLVFGAASAILYWEYHRTSQKAAENENLHHQLQEQVEKLQKKTDEIEDFVFGYDCLEAKKQRQINKFETDQHQPTGYLDKF